MSSDHAKKHRSLRVQSKVVPSSSSTTNINNPTSIIATPPRAALQGRQQHNNAETPDENNAVAGSASKSSSPHDVNPSSSPADVTPHEPTPPPIHAHTHHKSTSRNTKDARIADLEHDLATTTAEFSVELASLTQKLTTEMSTSAFWQQKHSLLHQTFLKTDTDLRLLRSQQALHVSQQEERERDIKTRISSLMLDRDAFREAYNEAMGELRAKEEEVRVLQGQVRGLKSWVSSTGSSKGAEQVSDESFGEGMQRLGNGLQNWVITNFRRVKIGRSFLVSLLCSGIV